MSSEGAKIILSKQNLYRLVGSYFIISLSFYNIMSVIIFFFVLFLGTLMRSNF